MELLRFTPYEYYDFLHTVALATGPDDMPKGMTADLMMQFTEHQRTRVELGSQVRAGGLRRVAYISAVLDDTTMRMEFVLHPIAPRRRNHYARLKERRKTHAS